MSAIWNINLYTKLSKDDAECNQCKKIIKTNFGSTSGLRVHLKQHAEYLEVFEKCLPKVGAISLDKFITVHGSGELSALDKQIIHFIAGTNSSFKAINHPTFHALFSCNHPLNKLKDEKHYRIWAFPRVYDKVKNAVRQQIDAVDFLLFTTDIWSSSKTNDSFISLTCHWITRKWERNQCVIAMKPFPGQHTSTNILRVFREILDDWGIPDSKCHVILRDHASNITKAFENEFSHADCGAHKLNLCVDKLFSSNVSDALAKCRSIVWHFSHSNLAYERLEEAQKSENNIPPHKLIQDVKTRWNSTYLMVQRLVEQKTAIELYSLRHCRNLAEITAGEWTILEQFGRASVTDRRGIPEIL